MMDVVVTILTYHLLSVNKFPHKRRQSIYLYCMITIIDAAL